VGSKSNVQDPRRDLSNATEPPLAEKHTKPYTDFLATRVVHGSFEPRFDLTLLVPTTMSQTRAHKRPTAGPIDSKSVTAFSFTALGVSGSSVCTYGVARSLGAAPVGV